MQRSTCQMEILPMEGAEVTSYGTISPYVTQPAESTTRSRGLAY
jgi:hypothetical protein